MGAKAVHPSFVPSRARAFRAFHDLLPLTTREGRDAANAYFAEGLRNAHAALRTDCEILCVVRCLGMLHSPLQDELAGYPCVELPRRDFIRLCYNPDSQSLGLVLRQRRLSLDDVLPKRFGVWMGLETWCTPGNVGTLLRTAAATGAEGVMLFSRSGEYPDLWDPMVVRASMGGLLGSACVHTTYRELRNWRFRKEFQVIGTAPENSVDYRKVRFRKPTVLMLGSERQGLTPGQRSACDLNVRIPMEEGTDSLNLAVAGSILAYEAYRQRAPVPD